MAQQVERTNISILGKINAGKSSLLNLLSGQKDFAIVDPTPGTTADNVVSLMEIHNLGPCKIFDTAGIDEQGELGEKKRKRAYTALEESDLVLITFDIANTLLTGDISEELNLFNRAQEKNKQVLLILNNIGNELFNDSTINDLLQDFDVPWLLINVSDFAEQPKLIDFILKNFVLTTRTFDIFPNLKTKGIVLLNIPMDEETPELRLLRPQDITIERLLRKYITPVLFRMNLSKARSSNPEEVSEEKNRYESLIKTLQANEEGLQMIITDSQAFDIVGKWTPKDVPLTSFSIAMTNFMTYGRLDYIAESTFKIDELQNGDTILIAESCNHNRHCDDIGTQQLPRLLKQKSGKELNFEFAFGRVFPDDLEKYKLIVHCGSCMTDRQKYYRRVEIAMEKGLPFTNYGMTLSYCQSPELFRRVLEPFKN